MLVRVLTALMIWVAVTRTLSDELFPTTDLSAMPRLSFPMNRSSFRRAAHLLRVAHVNVDTSFARLLALMPLGVIIFLTIADY